MTSTFLLLESLALMTSLNLGVRLLPFTVVRRGLDRWAGCSRRNTEDMVDQIAWAVRAIGRRMPGATCLLEALVAHCMLRRFGYVPALRIGVRRGASMSIDAHAWVECGGAIVIGTIPGLTEYAVLSP
ncbi:MAG: lasso peptide biosynthesis B2 protein [Vicinamibacterales bacterium]|nr:lasso peptide biosynthesis B2 protein [Vicinamibacterales bacterium]